MKAVLRVFRKNAGCRRVVDDLLRGNWRMESKVNPQNDSAVITARYVSGDEPTYFILPDNLSDEERKEYPLKLKMN